jgi:hypothetical protein
MFCEKAKPRRAKAARAVLIAVRRFVPSFEISFAVKRLDITVPSEQIIETKLPKDIGIDNSLYMAGHAVPKRESGIPRPMKAI